MERTLVLRTTIRGRQQGRFKTCTVYHLGLYLYSNRMDNLKQILPTKWCWSKSEFRLWQILSINQDGKNGQKYRLLSKLKNIYLLESKYFMRIRVWVPISALIEKHSSLIHRVYILLNWKFYDCVRKLEIANETSKTKGLQVHNIRQMNKSVELRWDCGGCWREARERKKLIMNLQKH